MVGVSSFIAMVLGLLLAMLGTFAIASVVGAGGLVDLAIR